MFKKLLDIWRNEEDPIREMIEELDRMLEIGQQMFQSVTDALFEGGDFSELKKKTYSSDGRLNELEQVIRRKVVVHLSLGNVSSLTSSLILTSVVKDAERLGDYVKNIYQAAAIVAPLKTGNYLEKTKEIRGAILEYFGRVREAFRESDEDASRSLLRDIFRYEKEIDRIVEEILANQGLENSVSFALINRYFKRILSHIGNIATSVVMPVDKLDYFDEGHREKLNKIADE